MKTTVEKVKDIIETELEDSIIQSYIDGADVWLLAALSEVSLPNDLFAEIERWVAAHMIAYSRERTAASEEAGGAKIVYSGKFGTGLNGTSYGQTAVNLDYTGTLADIVGGNKKIKFFAIKS